MSPNPIQGARRGERFPVETETENVGHRSVSHANLALLVAQFFFQVEAMDFCDCFMDGGQRSTSGSINTGLLVSVGVRVNLDDLADQYSVSVSWIRAAKQSD